MPNQSQKLWIVGCSITHGVGVSAEQRWGSLVGNALNIDPVFLTAEGSSIEWAADQILQANIGSGDTVLWGLTSVHRYVYYNCQGIAQHILRIYYDNHPKFEKIISIDRLVDINLAYKSANYISQVVNYLNKIQCNYVVNCLIPSIAEHQAVLAARFSRDPRFIIPSADPAIVPTAKNIFSRDLSSVNMYADRGTDGLHPGPAQHRVYADQFLEKLSDHG